MNGRRAKALRRQAEATTIGQPPRRLLQVKPINSFAMGMVFNDPASTRGRYLELKRRARCR